MPSSAMAYLTLADPTSSPWYYSLQARGFTGEQAALILTMSSEVAIRKTIPYVLVSADLLVRKSPLSLPCVLPGATKFFNLEEWKALRRVAYDSWKDEPFLRHLMERAGWGGDPSQEDPGATWVFLQLLTREIDRLTGVDRTAVVNT